MMADACISVGILDFVVDMSRHRFEFDKATRSRSEDKRRAPELHYNNTISSYSWIGRWSIADLLSQLIAARFNLAD